MAGDMISTRELLIVVVPALLIGLVVLGLIGYAIYHALSGPKKPKE